jgi:hypothetical protein
VRNSLARLVSGGHLKIMQTKAGWSRYTLVLFPRVRVTLKDGNPIAQ